MGKLDIDYQVLHDAFFKYQTKPHLSGLGDIYYEGKEFEARVRFGPFAVWCQAHLAVNAHIVKPHPLKRRVLGPSCRSASEHCPKRTACMVSMEQLVQLLQKQCLKMVAAFGIGRTSALDSGPCLVEGCQL